MTRINMRCPTCQSLNTQTLQAAFDQNSRNDGRRSFNQFALRIGPPLERETVTWPLIALCLLTYIADLAIVLAAALYPIPGFHRAHFFDFHVLALSFAVALASVAPKALRDMRYNRTQFSDELAAWREKAVCRRCTHVFKHGLGRIES